MNSENRQIAVEPGETCEKSFIRARQSVPKYLRIDSWCAAAIAPAALFGVEVWPRARDIWKSIKILPSSLGKNRLWSGAFLSRYCWLRQRGSSCSQWSHQTTQRHTSSDPLPSPDERTDGCVLPHHEEGGNLPCGFLLKPPGELEAFPLCIMISALCNSSILESVTKWPFWSLELTPRLHTPPGWALRWC